MSEKNAVPNQKASVAVINPTRSRILQRQCACGQHTDGGECESCKQKDATLQRAAISPIPTNDSVPTIVHDVLNSPGHSLDRATRSYFEPRFGHDFSNVRVHTDSQAAQSARSVNALAYTVGQNVVFGTSQYQPGTAQGNRLLAHELAHTIQQASGGSFSPGLSPYSQSETEAEHVSQAITNNQSRITIGVHSKIGLSRALATKNLVTLSDTELDAEDQRVRNWLSKHSPVELDYYPTQDYFNEIETEVARRGKTSEEQPKASPGLQTEGSTANAAIQSYDATIRVNKYVEPAKELAEKVFNDLESGKISHIDARIQASQGRNELLNQTRNELSPGGKAFSEAIKDEGKPLEELVKKYSLQLLEKPDLMAKYGLKTLDPKSPLFDAVKFELAMRELGETAEVSREIIKAAGRTGKTVTAMAKFTKVAGPIGVAVGAGISGYEIITAPEGQKLHVAGREASGFAGGTLGSIGGGLLAGWTASLVCGPAAPACAIVVSLVVVGGASYAGGKIGEAAFERATSN